MSMIAVFSLRTAGSTPGLSGTDGQEARVEQGVASVHHGSRIGIRILTSRIVCFGSVRVRCGAPWVETLR